MKNILHSLLLTLLVLFSQSSLLAQTRVAQGLESSEMLSANGFTPPYSLVLVTFDGRLGRPECSATIVPALYSINPKMSGKFTLSQLTKYVENDLGPARARELGVSIQAIISIYANYSYKNVIVPLAIRKLELAIAAEVKNSNLPTEALKNTVLQQLRAIVNYYTNRFENEINDSTNGSSGVSPISGGSAAIGGNFNGGSNSGFNLNDWCASDPTASICDRSGSGSTENIARITRNNNHINEKTINKTVLRKNAMTSLY